MKKCLLIGFVCALIVSLTACSDGSDQEAKAWELIEKSASESNVQVLVDTSDEHFLEWLKEDFTAYMKTNYSVNLLITEQPLAKTAEKLKNDLDKELELGQYDVVLLFGDSFKTFKDQDLLYGPFVDKLPNTKVYMDTHAVEMTYDEGLRIGGYEMPIAKNQFSMIYNEDFFYEIPETNEAFVELVKGFEGQFTYPDPRQNKVGEAFVLSMVAPYIDYDKVTQTLPDDATLLEMIRPGLEHIKSMGVPEESLATSFEDMDYRFKNLELAFSMSNDYNYATDQLKAYEYPELAGTFLVPDGSTGYTDYAGIAYNSPNKSGAMVVINALISPDIQGEIYDPSNWGKLPVYNLETVDATGLSAIKKVKLKSSSLKYDDLLPNRYPEMQPDLRDQIIRLWEQVVYGDANQ